VVLKVCEIFHSIQGESSYAGYPCVFVRLAGCNLRCSYCDTRYAWEEGEELEIEEIVERAGSHACPLIEITGGEPLIQEQTPQLVVRLIERKFTVLLETNGTVDIDRADPRCVRIVDVKCPSSGEHERNDPENFGRLTERDELKLVIGDRADYEYAREIVRTLSGRGVRAAHIHFSPVFGKIAPDVLGAWILEDSLPVRLNLQLQKIVWDPGRRGV
jgi:7-carboxy-7-deazaguanine synthase